MRAFVYNCIFFFVFGFLFVSEKFSSALPWARYSVTPSAPSHFLLKKRRPNNFELIPQRFSLLYPVPVYLCLTGWRGVILSEIQISIQIPSCAVGYMQTSYLIARMLSQCLILQRKGWVFSNGSKSGIKYFCFCCCVCFPSVCVQLFGLVGITSRVAALSSDPIFLSK